MSISQTLSIVDAFAHRHSCRSFSEKDISQDKKQSIQNILSDVNKLQSPFKTSGIEISETGPGLNRFWSTSNESGWLVEKVPSNHKSELMTMIIDASFKMQIAVMKMTQINIGTCWMAGTFNESEAEKRFPGFIIKAVVAFGEERKSKHLMGKIFGMFGGHDKRLKFEQLFYDDDNKRFIKEDDFANKTVSQYPSYMHNFLNALRSGPSPMNAQTWRFVLSGQGKEVHLFDEKNDENSWFTSGIALANLKLLEELRGGSCNFEMKNPTPQNSPLGGKYIATAIYNE